MPIITIIPLIAFLANGVLIYILVRAGINTRQRRAFGGFLIFNCLISLSSFMLHANLALEPELWLRALMASAAIAIAFTLHFAWEFPSRKRDAKWIVVIAYAFLIPLLLLIFATDYFVEGVNYLGSGNIDISYGPWMLIAYLYIFLVCMASITLLTISRRMARNVSEKQRVTYPLMANIILLIGGLLNAVPRISDYPVDIFLQLIAAVLISYAVLRYHLLDIEIIIRRGTIYGGLVVLFTACYLMMVFGIQRVLVTSTAASAIGAAILTAILLALVLQSSRHWIYRLVNKLFYGRAYDYRQRLKEFSEAMSTIIDLDELAGRLVAMTSDTMMTSKTALFLADETSERYFIRTSKGLSVANQDDTGFSIDSPMVKYCASTREILTRSDIERLTSSPGTLKRENELIGVLTPHVIVQLKSNEKLVGFLTLGEKQSGEPYLTEDMELLFTMGQQAAIALSNAITYARLEKLKITDDLTGLYNHRYFHERLVEELERSRRSGTAVALVMIDVDMFHSFNEIHGHVAGDEALQEVAQIMRLTVRRTDLLFRYGGEEFAVIAPGINSIQAHSIAERVREAIESNVFPCGSGIQGILTISQGIASFPADSEDMHGLIFSADMALLSAKRRGRNRTCLYTPIVATATPLPREQELELDRPEQIGTTADSAYVSTIYALAAAVDAKDHFTFGHSQKVAKYAVALGTAIGLSEDVLAVLRASALLHDIGKIGIPDQILRKKGRLTENEREEVRKHPIIAQTILRHVPMLASLLPAITHHHEAYDGTGYPSGLKGDAIPLEARILHIADAWDALTSERPYRNKVAKEQAIAELRRCAGTDFDPQLIEAFCKLKESGGK